MLHIRLESGPYSSASIEAGFRQNGFEYHSILWQQLRFNEGIEQTRKHILQKAAQLKPTIIFCHLQNPEAFDKETWLQLSQHGFVINYTFDVRYATEMEWMYEVAPLIGWTFFACSEDVSNCILRGVNNVSQCHSSCDMELFKSNGKSLFAFDVVFCGNRYDNTSLNFPLAAERQAMVDLIEKKYQSRCMIYGLGQKGGLIQPGVEANVYNFSRIAISQNNFKLHDYTSDRLWRIMATGCFCLTKYFPGIEEIFQKEVDLDWFDDFSEMIYLIDFYLNNDELRKKIAISGSNKVRKFHNWGERIKLMTNTIKNELLSELVIS